MAINKFEAFEGVCRDGPWKGKRKSARGDFFTVELLPDMPPVLMQYDLRNMVEVETNRVYYYHYPADKSVKLVDGAFWSIHRDLTEGEITACRLYNVVYMAKVRLSYVAFQLALRLNDAIDEKRNKRDGSG